MLDLADIDRIAGHAAATALRSHRVAAHAQPTIDSQGQDALRVTIVLPDQRNTPIDGDLALDALVRIRQDLVIAGEERFPIVEFITQDELAANGDSEP